MGKYRRYKNRVEMFLSSERGKRILNFAYSWGASVIVIGAMFKIVHLPYADTILCVSLIFESLVFFISAFEHPSSEYHWEEVFPVLKSKNPLDRPDFSGGGGSNGGGANNHTPIVGNFEGSPIMSGSYGGAPVYAGDPSAMVHRQPVTPEQSAHIGLATMGLNVSEEDAANLSNSIRKLSEAADQIARMADMTDATQSYVTQITAVSQNLERFNTVTSSLSDVSDSLVNSCKAISGVDAAGAEEGSLGYVRQMEQLNEKLSGLNEFYDVHLSGLRSQMDTIRHINAGLQRIREMYDSSVIDSSAFRAENERMAQLLSQLNQVYGRLLQAMTVNMPMGGGMYAPQQPYPQQGYPQQPPYGAPIR